jgi:hypothetical protein
MNVELRRDVTAGKAIENAVAALGAAFADDHFSQRRVGLAGEGRDRVFWKCHGTEVIALIAINLQTLEAKPPSRPGRRRVAEPVGTHSCAN